MKEKRKEREREEERERERETTRGREKEREEKRERGEREKERTEERGETEALRVCIQNACVCTFKTSPCVPPPRAHVLPHVRVVRVHTVTF